MRKHALLGFDSRLFCDRVGCAKSHCHKICLIMEYLEVVCPQCRRSVEFRPEEVRLDCPFCGAEVVKGCERKTPRNGQSEQSYNETWEKAKEEGRKEERLRIAHESAACLFVSIVIGAVGGGYLGGQADKGVGGVVIGALVGGVIGAIHHLLGCLLTIVLVIVILVVAVMSVFG